MRSHESIVRNSKNFLFSTIRGNEFCMQSSPFLFLVYFPKLQTLEQRNWEKGRFISKPRGCHCTYNAFMNQKYQGTEPFG